MNSFEKERLLALRKTFDLNYRITNLYSEYLTVCPTLITKNAVDTLMREAEIERLDAIAILLSEVFGLDFERDPKRFDDRKIILDYIYPSIRLHTVTEYTENPYYKKIAPRESVRDGDWEFRWQTYPAYRAAIGDDMIIRESFLEVPPLAFFDTEFTFPAVLEGGNEWMTLTPADVDTSAAAIEAAHGRVVTFGLGLGYFTYMASEKDTVESVTVIEKSEAVIRLFERHILPRFEHKEKVRIINADAFEYAERVMPSENYDYAFVDTWRDASDGLPMYERMKALEQLSSGTKFDYWIENFIISRKRAFKFEELWEKLEKKTEDMPKSYDEFIKRLKE